MFDFLKPKRQRVMADVTTVRMTSPNMLCVTLGGPGIKGLIAADKFDKPGAWVKLGLPTGESRAYTLRRIDPVAGTLDLEMVLHDNGGVTGPASTWASHAKVGDQIGIAGPRDGRYRLPGDAAWLILAGDMTALPAMQSIAQVLPPGIKAQMYVEVDSLEDKQTVESPAQLEVTWLLSQGRPGGALRELLMKKDIAAGPGYVWIAGESSVTHALRTHYLKSLGMQSMRVSALGYWKVDESAHRDRG